MSTIKKKVEVQTTTSTYFNIDEIEDILKKHLYPVPINGTVSVDWDESGYGGIYGVSISVVQTTQSES